MAEGEGLRGDEYSKIESTPRKGWRANEKHIMTGLGIQKRQWRRLPGRVTVGRESSRWSRVKCDNLRGRANVAGDDKPSAI